MSELIFPCPHCTQGSRLDPALLPDGPAAYPCPHCQQQVVVDKRELLARQTETAPQQPAAAAPAAKPPPDTDTAPGRRIPSLPADATLPSGIIVGDDDETVQQIKLMLAAVGSEVERIESAEKARELIINERPKLCICVGGAIPPAPYAALAPLTGLPAQTRRELYIALIGNDLKTLNGNSAFLYQVNLVVGRQDLPRFDAALYSGIDYHDRLYRPYYLAVEHKGAN